MREAFRLKLVHEAWDDYKERTTAICKGKLGIRRLGIYVLGKPGKEA
jgi:hypothetical protein